MRRLHGDCLQTPPDPAIPEDRGSKDVRNVGQPDRTTLHPRRPPSSVTYRLQGPLLGDFKCCVLLQACTAVGVCHYEVVHQSRRSSD
jgi:hypothetical protein